MIETSSSMAHALPPARRQQSYQLCRGDSCAINLCYEWSRQPWFPTWCLENSEGGRQQDYGIWSHDERSHRGMWSMCCPAGEEMRTSYILSLKSHEVKWSESHSVVSNSLWPLGLYSSWNSLGQNIGVGSLLLFQGIFPTKGSNQGLSHCRQILYQLSHQESPRILWVGYPFSRRSSWPRNWTRVSWIAGRFFTKWAIREALKSHSKRF